MGRLLAGRRTEVEQLVDALLVRAKTELGAARDAIVEWAVGTEPGSLSHEIDQAVSVPATQDELSQHLAERGVLPMFGFPTRVRNLFLRRPRRAYPGPPRGVIDRQLEIAILDFAPGSETVRDKQVHTAVGLASFRPAGNHVTPEANPLGRAHRITLCRRCGSVRREQLGPSIACAECSAASPDFGPLDLAEPTGFRSAYRAEDFEGAFTRNARATTPRIAPELDKMNVARAEESLA